MNKEYAPYEESLALKELGFNEKCYGYYTKDEEYFYFDVDDLSSAYTKNMDNLVVNSVDELYCTAPLYQQAFKWFMNTHDLIPTPYKLEEFDEWSFSIYIRLSGETISKGEFYSSEEAELACLKELIKFVQKK